MSLGGSHGVASLSIIWYARGLFGSPFHGYVNGISTAAVGSGKVQFKITYIGGFDKLLEALRSKYYNLKSTGDFYIIEKI